MSYIVTINGTPITLPSDSESPQWSGGLIQFTQAVETALSAAVGAYDVAPQVMVLDSVNGGTVDVTNLAFSTSNVRAAYISYTIYRTTTSNSAYEAGNMIAVYNPSGTPGSQWEVSRDYVGEGEISFSITDSGTVSITTTAIAGSNHVANLSYSAKALVQS